MCAAACAFLAVWRATWLAKWMRAHAFFFIVYNFLDEQLRARELIIELSSVYFE